VSFKPGTALESTSKHEHNLIHATRAACGRH